MEFDDEIKAAIQRIADSRAALIDDFRKRSLTDPKKRGVLVEDDPTRGDLKVSLDESVPQDKIYYKAAWTIGGTGN